MDLPYAGEENNGLPDEVTLTFMNEIEDRMLVYLEGKDGYINIGRETGMNVRSIYFACKEFRQPSKVLYNLAARYTEQLELEFFIYKDKYWLYFDRYIAH